MNRLLGAAALACAAVVAMAASNNWVATFAETKGGHVIGNPAAKTKVIEFVSYTCPHCAHFEQEAGGAIKLAWVQPGKVSVEVRHLVRDPIDLTAAILTNCGPKEKFFQNHALFMLQQDKWIARAQAATDAQKQRWSTGTMTARWKAIASDLGFYDMMATRGYNSRAGPTSACRTRPPGVRSSSSRTRARKPTGSRARRASRSTASCSKGCIRGTRCRRPSAPGCGDCAA